MRSTGFLALTVTFLHQYVWKPVPMLSEMFPTMSKPKEIHNFKFNIIWSSVKITSKIWDDEISEWRKEVSKMSTKYIFLLIKQICHKQPKSNVSNSQKSDTKEQKIGSCFGRNVGLMRTKLVLSRIMRKVCFQDLWYISAFAQTWWRANRNCTVFF